jgi:hypothetical protein
LALQKFPNKRFRRLSYGIKRVTKGGAEITARTKSTAMLYNKDYPSNLHYSGTKRFPPSESQTFLSRLEYLFMAIDDFSRERYAAILQDKIFLE